ncbi:MAG: hypothetical protein WC558_07080 [Patulibacter sp.]
MAGRLLGLLINLIVFPVMAASVGYVFFDKIPVFVNTLPNFPMDGINTLTWLKYIFVAGIFFFVFAISWNHMAQSQNEQDQVT